VSRSVIQRSARSELVEDRAIPYPRLVEIRVPPREVVDARGETTRADHLPTRDRGLPAVVLAEDVPGGAIVNDGGVIIEDDGALHPERVEDPLLDKCRELHPAHAAHRHRQEEVAGVRIRPLRPGAKVQRLLLVQEEE
jgi:hypothetical protein